MNALLLVLWAIVFSQEQNTESCGLWSSYKLKDGPTSRKWPMQYFCVYSALFTRSMWAVIEKYPNFAIMRLSKALVFITISISAAFTVPVDAVR